MDGHTKQHERGKLVNEFNSNKNIHLFLLSTKACSHGINLVGANRVVIYDSSWNPCYEQQALCRVYRHDQTKPCFVYRLIMGHCLDEKIYNRQVNKQGIAIRVVDNGNPDPHITFEEMSRLHWDIDDDDDDECEKIDLTNVQYTDMVLQNIIQNISHILLKPPSFHETLLTDNELTKLSADEKTIAFEDYQKNIQSTKK